MPPINTPENQNASTPSTPVQPQQRFDPASIYPVPTPAPGPSPTQDMQTPVNQPQAPKPSSMKVFAILAALIILAGGGYYYWNTHLSTQAKLRKVATGTTGEYEPAFTLYKPTYLPTEYYLEAMLTPASKPIPARGVDLYYKVTSDTGRSYQIGKTMVISENTVKTAYKPPTNCINTDQTVTPGHETPCQEIGKTKDGHPIYRTIGISHQPDGPFTVPLGETLVSVSLPTNDTVTQTEMLKVLASLTKTSLTDLIKEAKGK